MAFEGARDILYDKVHAGHLGANEYETTVLEDFSALVRTVDPDNIRNYCLLAYMIASHLIVYGQDERAELLTSDLIDFLDQVAAYPQEYEHTVLVANKTLSWHWYLYRYKALRFDAIAQQHILLAKGNIGMCIQAHKRCLDFALAQAERDFYDPLTSERFSAESTTLYQKCLIEIYSDIIRAFFRYSTRTEFVITEEISRLGFRSYAKQFLDKYDYLHERLRADNFSSQHQRGALRQIRREDPTPLRWHDTAYKLYLLSWGDPQDVTMNWDLSTLSQKTRKTDLLSFMETYYSAHAIACNFTYDQTHVDVIDTHIAHAEKMSLNNGAKHLHRLRSRFGGHG